MAACDQDGAEADDNGQDKEEACPCLALDAVADNHQVQDEADTDAFLEDTSRRLEQGASGEDTEDPEAANLQFVETATPFPLVLLLEASVAALQPRRACFQWVAFPALLQASDNRENDRGDTAAFHTAAVFRHY